MVIMSTEPKHEGLSNLSDIQNFYYGQSVFITGVTGLVGKVVLEKLLRCCPGIGTMYVLLRPRKGLSAEERLEKILNLELFKHTKEVFPEYRKKIQAVEGDITKDRLGLSFDDYESIRKNVTIIFHTAASVTFTDPIKIAVEHNIMPVLRLIELCKEMTQIKAFVHTSTAYVKRETDGTVIEEIPKFKIGPFQLLDALEWMDEATMKAVSDFLLENKWNTYMITKGLAEKAIEEKRGDLPIAVVRPCYISPTYKDPFPGWIDALQGMSGLLLAGAKGALRTLRSVKNLKINVIPVDVVVNTMVVSAWHVGITKPPSLFVVNCVMDFQTLPDADQDILNFVLTKRDEYPLAKIFRYPHFTIYYNDFGYYLHALIDQWIPALFIDFFLFIFTGRTMLVKIYYKIHTLYDVFYKVGKDPWICHIDNYKMLENSLSKEDSKIFSMNVDNFDWTEYIEACLIGGRRFLANEDPSNIPYAKKKAKIWWGVTTTLKWIFILYFLYYIFSCFFYDAEPKMVNTDQ